jgi:prefoldin beta subunit
MESREKLQEFQMLEQSMQSILIQKQTFQIQIADINNALEELTKHNDEVYKIVGSLMLKSKKDDVEKELKQNKELISVRLKNLDRQEKTYKEKLATIREELIKEMSNIKETENSNKK